MNYFWLFPPFPIDVTIELTFERRRSRRTENVLLYPRGTFLWRVLPPYELMIAYNFLQPLHPTLLCPCYDFRIYIMPWRWRADLPSLLGADSHLTSLEFRVRTTIYCLERRSSFYHLVSSYRSADCKIHCNNGYRVNCVRDDGPILNYCNVHSAQHRWRSSRYEFRTIA